MTDRQEQRVSHDDARKAAQRLINSHFGNSNQARASIPASHYDDDILLMRYIQEQEVLRALPRDEGQRESGAGKSPDVNAEMLAALRLALTDCTPNAYVERVIEAVIARAEAAQASREQHP